MRWIPACAGMTEKNKEPLRSGSFLLHQQSRLS
jgi:hypothetical protein